MTRLRPGFFIAFDASAVTRDMLAGDPARCSEVAGAALLGGISDRKNDEKIIR
jgi:hypothetical protein